MLVGLGVLGLTCSPTAQYFAARRRRLVTTELRTDLYAHINRFSYQELDTIGTSTLITRMTSDENQVQNGVNLLLRLFFTCTVYCDQRGRYGIYDQPAPDSGIFLAAIPLIGLAIFWRSG